jgi:hypothetical protein
MRPLDQLIGVSAGANKPHQVSTETLCGSMIRLPD